MRAAALLLLLLPVAVPAAPENLVPNGGFEKGLEGWAVRNPSGLLKAEPDAKVRKAGKASVHLVKKGGSGFMADGVVFEIPKLPAGVKVVVSAQVRGKDMKNAWMKFSAYDESGEQLLDPVAVNETNLTGTFDWKEVKREFEIPARAVRGDLALWLYMDGEAWLDEVEAIPSGKGVPPPRKEPAKPLDAGIRKWLDANAVKVKTLDAKAPFDDLAPLKEILKDARIVHLGENTHGDGACFEAKERLVRFLHEEMGFEVLAFESGLFECDRANALLRKGDGEGAMEAGVFGIWHTAPVRRLFRYLADRSKAPAPLVLAGFDCRWSGNLADRFPEECAAFLEPVTKTPEADVAAMKRLRTLVWEQGEKYAPSPKELDAGLGAADRMRKSLEEHRARLVEKHGEPEVAFFERALANWKDNEAFERARSDGSLGTWGHGNLRDGHMSANLKWLAEVRYPGKKIVTWAATFHVARNLPSVGPGKSYDGCRNMGQGVHEAFGKASYVVGFAAHGGHCGSFGNKSALHAPREGSVEDLLHRYGQPLLFVDLRREGPFAGEMRMAPMSYSRDMKAPWPEVLDAVFFIDEMTPAR